MDKNKYDRIYTHILTDKEAIECMGEKLTILTLQLTEEKHRADVAEEALKLACQQLGYELHQFGVNKNIVVEPRIIEFKEQAEERLKERSILWQIL